MNRTLALTLLIELAVANGGYAQQDARNLGPKLLQDAQVKAALEAVARNEPRVIEDQIRLCEIPAPPFMEQKRAEAYKRELEALGLSHVRIDRAGNVIGDRPGAAVRPRVVFAAHLDTVFPEGTDVRVTRTGRVLKGPGIGDNCRGLAVLLGVVRALNGARVQTPGTITIVGNVGEEGLGDLRGVKHLVNQELKGQIDRFVAVDGAGLGITTVAVGSLRYRVTYKGPGGHSYGSFGAANPIHALGRAIDKISRFTVPTDPRTTFSVGRVGGGTSVNSIAFEAWMEVDLRSSDAKQLQTLDGNFLKAIDTALAEENERWGYQGQISVVKELVGSRPAGSTARGAAIVETAISVSDALQLPIALGEGSTDANVPMSLNLPAIAIDAGGSGRSVHAPGESFDITDSHKGTARALVLAVALAQK